jgi:hypothetical protein
MKTKLIALACMLIAPLAFGQADATTRTEGPTTQTNTTGPTKIGSVDSYIAGSNITLTSTLLTHPSKYMVAKDVQYENADGKAVGPNSVRPGTRVQLGFNGEGKVDRITLLDLR